MQTRLITRQAIAVASAVVVLAACGGGGDKAGGAQEAKPRVLTMANANEGGPPIQLSSWADEVKRLSDGKLVIEFKSGWRLGEPAFEAGTLDDLRAGKVDLAWVGARAFDTVGVKSFQALVAPLLIDSYDMEAEVFEQGIPAHMLDGVGDIDLVGIGVLPGPMRKLLGLSKPFAVPEDFAGEVVGLQESGVAEKTLRALGATPRPVPSSAPLDGLDAYEQQLSSIEGNGYDAHAKYVTSNVNLWPRPLVIAMGKKAFDSLTDKQQAVLRDAVEAAVPESIAASRSEDDDAAAVLCRRGMTFVTASTDQLAELRTALEPVYTELTSDPVTKSQIDAIESVKTKIATSAEAPSCEDAPASAAASSIPNGTYETTVTDDDWNEAGLAEEAGEDGTGVFRIVLDNGDLTLFQPDGEIGFGASYTLFRDKIEAHAHKGGDTVTARWSSDGKTLRFTDVRLCVGSSCGDEVTPYAVVWASHPWMLRRETRTPIDGTWEFTTTRAELEAAGADLLVENFGSFRWVLDDGKFEMTQKNGASDRWTKGTYVVRDDVVVFTIEDYGGEAPNDASEKTGEVFTYTWSLYRDKLTLGPVDGAVSPEGFASKPWTRVG